MSSSLDFSFPSFYLPSSTKAPHLDSFIYQVILVLLALVMTILTSSSASRIKKLKEELDMAIQHQNILKHDNETMSMWIEEFDTHQREKIIQEEINNSLDGDILRLLNKNTEGMTSKEIALALSGDKKEINARLYTLNNFDIVSRVIGGKKAPVWSLTLRSIV